MSLRSHGRASHEQPEVRAFPGARLRPARSLRVVYGLFAFLVLLVATVSAGVPGLRAAMGALSALLVLPMGVGIRWVRRREPRGGGRIEVRREGLFVEGRLALPRETLEWALVTRDARGVTVSIQRRPGFVSVVDVGSVDEGRELVGALGLDATRALSTFPFDSPFAAQLPHPWGIFPFVALLLTLLLLAVARGVPWVLVPLLVAWCSAVVGGIAPVHVTIGLDGLMVRWLWRRELIRFEDLRAIEHDGKRLRLRLADGSRRSLSAAWGPMHESKSTATGFASRAAYLDAVVARVNEALSASGKQAGRLPAAALARRGREIDAWVRALRGVLGRGAAGFREPETAPEQLWSTVEDGGAEEAARAAAAIALGPTLDDAERERLHSVARVVVSPRLRVAFEAAADSDEEGEREALAEIEQGRKRA